MANIYLGNDTRIEQDVLDALTTLPDDFWVFAEFNITGRNIDFFVARAVPDELRSVAHSTLIVTEVKRVSRALDGAVDMPWRMQMDDGVWQEIVPSNTNDMNYYWQAVHAANALNDWLWNNQQRYIGDDEPRPMGEFKVWPDILLLSPPGVKHRLPMQPPSRFGRWFTTMDEWLNHLNTWSPRIGAAMTSRQLSEMGNALGLRQVARPVPASVEVKQPAASNGVADFVAWITELEARVKRLEEQAR